MMTRTLHSELLGDFEVRLIASGGGDFSVVATLDQPVKVGGYDLTGTMNLVVYENDEEKKVSWIHSTLHYSSDQVLFPSTTAQDVTVFNAIAEPLLALVSGPKFEEDYRVAVFLEEDKAREAVIEAVEQHLSTLRREQEVALRDFFKALRASHDKGRSVTTIEVQ